MVQCFLTPQATQVLTGKIGDVREIPENGQETGKLYAYTQVVIMLVDGGWAGDIQLFRTLEKKTAACGCTERQWWTDYTNALDRARRVR